MHCLRLKQGQFREILELCAWLQALCELMTNAGKKLEATTKNKAKFETFFTALEKLSKNRMLLPRIRFMIRDVIDLRKSSWIPRRDVLQVDWVCS